MLDLMRDIILATDLAHHLRIFKDLQKMAEGNASGEQQTCRERLLCFMVFFPQRVCRARPIADQCSWVAELRVCDSVLRQPRQALEVSGVICRERFL